ncbi:N-acetylglucosamine-6-phosphate deacetylase [soil metagenome]
MNPLALIGGTIVTPLEERITDLIVDDGIVQSVGAFHRGATNFETLDVRDCYVTPGLIDLQLNGGSTCNFWGDPTHKELADFCRAQVSAGVTTFLPTLITADVKHIIKNVKFLESLGVGAKGSGKAFGAVADCPARMPGVHLEGPCLSPQRPGVHPPEWIKPLSKAIAEQLNAPSVRMITVAPESDSSDESLKYLFSTGVVPSLGHSNATFEEAQLAFDRGIRLMTHTFNALPPLHHRAPGAVTAAMLDDRVTCCVICDGLHVDEAAVKLLFKIKGVEKVILVTDAAQIGTTGGGLVGSSIELNEAIKNVVNWKAATFVDAIRMATYNPAQAMGWLDKIGDLSVGKCADMVVWDKQSLEIKHVFVSGVRVAGN